MLTCLKRLYEGGAGSPVAPFSIPKGAVACMNNPEGLFPCGERGKGDAPSALPLCSLRLVNTPAYPACFCLSQRAMSYLPVPGFSLVFPVFFIPGVISGVLLVNFLSCSSVAITRKQGRAMAPFGSRPALLSGRRAPLRQGGCCAPAGLRRTRKLFRSNSRV